MGKEEYKLPGRWPRSTRRPVAQEELRPVLALYRQARTLDAFELSKTVAPLQAWASCEPDAEFNPRNLAADLANELAGHRLSDWLDITSYRDTPNDEHAKAGFATWLRVRRGPIVAWWFLSANAPREESTAPYKFRWHTLRSAIACHFRDFDLAKSCAEEAAPFCTRPELLPMAEATRFRAQDRLEEALAAARRAHALRPTLMASSRQIVEILLLQNRDEECLGYLEDALGRVQDSYLLSLKIRLLIEREEFSDALAGLDLYEDWAPLIELNGRRWLSAKRADACYHLGLMDEAANWADKVGDDFHRAFAVRLRAEKRRVRVRLPVGFIRQDHNTCGPATLTALANFWGLSADQGAVAESICYDGTYDYQERKWVEENGFSVREFRVTWEASRKLIDLGIPFALVTSWPGAAHLQAVVGYDAVWQSLLIRDPGERDIGVFDWDATDKAYRAVGPRGMAFVPNARKELLEGLDLPEAALYDANYGISLALHRHQRQEAVALLAALESEFPGQRLTIVGRRLVADYDNNAPAQLACVRELLELFPGDERHSLSLLYYLREAGLREERTSILEALIRKEDCHPLLWKEFAIERSEDSREEKLALRYLRKAHRAQPWHGNTLSRMADILWNRGEIPRATELYRFVACAEHTNENASRSYFIATRQTRSTEESIQFLRNRFERYGSKSPDPIRTLFYALEQLGRVPEAFQELAKAVGMRPTDGVLLCYAADMHRNYGRKEEAKKLLAEAEKECPRARWLRISARVAEQECQLLQALKFWEEVASMEPLAEDAHSEVADLLSKTQGKKEALAYLRSVHARSPYNLGLGRLLHSRLKGEDRPEIIALCREMVSNHPSDAWALRELANQLSQIPPNLDEALEKALLARDMEPRTPASHNVLGRLLERLGRSEEAREAYRQSIRLNVDGTYAIARLVDLDASQDEKRRDLLFVREELARQVVFGDGLEEFREQAARALPPLEVLECLQEAKEARPDLWNAWSSMVLQLSQMGRQEEALALALETTQRFPLHAGSWRGLGEVYSKDDRWEDAARSFEKAVAISWDWISAIAELSGAYRMLGQPEKSCEVLQNALRHMPTSHVLHGTLAEVLRFEGKTDEALPHLRQALQLNPDYSWGWDRLRDWGSHTECLSLARTLTEQRPGEAQSWLRLAENLDSAKDLPEILVAMDRAISLDPHDSDAYDQKAMTLVNNRRFQQALDVLTAAPWGGHLPTNLRGRAAWIENQRGDRKKALTMMEKVVADDSTYYWGWQRVSEWLDEENRHPEAVKAADHLVALRPDSAISLGFRADARLKQGNRSGAIEDLRRAHALNPDYRFATWTLFDLLLDDEEYEQAASLLEDARRCPSPTQIGAGQIRLDLARDHTDHALDGLKGFGASTDVTVDALEKIEAEFQKKDAQPAFDRVLEDLIASGKATGPTLALWARRKTAPRNREIGPVIARCLREDKEAARIAVDGYLRALGKAGRFGRCAADLLKEQPAWLAESTHTWGLMGYALNRSGRAAACARWMAGWRKRDGLECWMLLNLSHSLRDLNEESESSEVLLRVIEINPSDETASVQLAFDAAVRGDASAAERHLKPLDKEELKKTYAVFARELIDAARMNHSSRYYFGQSRLRLRRQLACSGNLWEFVRAYHIAVFRLAAVHGLWNAPLYRMGAGKANRLLFKTRTGLRELFNAPRSFFRKRFATSG